MFMLPSSSTSSTCATAARVPISCTAPSPVESTRPNSSPFSTQSSISSRYRGSKMCSGMRSVGTSTIGSGKSPSSGMEGSLRAPTRQSKPSRRPQRVGRPESPVSPRSRHTPVTGSTLGSQWGGGREHHAHPKGPCALWVWLVGRVRVVSSGFSDVADGFFRPSVDSLTPYQPGKPVEDVQRELGLERVIKLASNEGPFGPFEAAQEAMARAAAELNRYPDGGAYRLHEALAARHGVAIDEVCVGAGADGCIDMLSQAILDPGDA